MEYKIRQKAEGVCEYTGNTASVLIKLYDKDEKETGWMSAEALKAALNLVGALDGSRQEIIPQFHHQPFCQPYPNPIPVDPLNPLGQVTVTNMEVNQALQENIKAAFPAAAIPNSKKSQKKNHELLRQVEADCRELLENPPPNGLGKEDSSTVGEMHIREIISEYQDLFKGSEDDLYNIINRYFGMPRFRFDFLIGRPIL